MSMQKKKNGIGHTYLFNDVDVSSTSLISGGRAGFPDTDDGVLVMGGGAEYPREPFIGVFNCADNIPFALREASRSPSPPGIGGPCGLDGAGGSCDSGA